MEVHEEIGVELIGPVGLALELDQPALDPGIELVVPGREQRVRDVHPITVERVLDHLRPAVQRSARLRMTAVPAEQAAEPDLGFQLRVGRVGHVVVTDVAVQPVREEQVLVVEREHQVGDQPGDAALERPALELLVAHVDHLAG